jgi:hypothetical protein
MVYRFEYLSINKSKINYPIFPIVRNFGFFIFRGCSFFGNNLHKPISFFYNELRVFCFKYLPLRIYQLHKQNVLCICNILQQQTQNNLSLCNILKFEKQNVLCFCNVLQQQKKNILWLRDISQQHKQNLLSLCYTLKSSFEYHSRQCKYLPITNKSLAKIKALQQEIPHLNNHQQLIKKDKH